MMEPTRVISPSVFALFDGVSLLASVASLILSVLAIGLALWFKREADKVNGETMRLLMDIRTDAKSIVGGVWREVHATGDWWRANMTGNQATGISVVQQSPASSIGGNQIGP